MSLGYRNVYRMPVGYKGWLDAEEPVISNHMEQELLIIGDFFPKCELTLLNPALDRKYLAIPDHKRSIRLVDIPAEYLYVEIYNELCLGCIAEINNYKKLFERFSASPEIRNKIKLIGIGAGSKKRNVVKFRKKYQIQFPLFADYNWHLFECLGSPILPTSYLIKKGRNHEREVILVQRDHIEDIDALSDEIMKIILN